MVNPAPGFAAHPGHTITISAPTHTVKVRKDGHSYATTKRAVRLDEGGYPPRYYIPMADAEMGRFDKTDHATHCPFKGDASYWTIRGPNGERFENAVWSYRAPYDECLAIKDLLCFYDSQFEIAAEDETP